MNKAIIAGIAIVLIIATVVILTVQLSSRQEIIPPDADEEYIDSIIADIVGGEVRLDITPLISTKETATSYARLLYAENIEEWDDEFYIWVKHYKEYGVWFATIRANEPILGGPPSIIFQDKDGRVIWYAK